MSVCSTAEASRLSTLTFTAVRTSEMRKFVLASFALLAFGGCFPFDAGHVRIDGPYYLWAADTRQDMALYYRVGRDGGVQRVASTVFAAGWDEHHIVVQRHPKGDRAVTEYFILDREKDNALAEAHQVVTGPLTAAEFAAARNRLGVSPPLAFTVRVRDLE